jgi:hypothetical protein
MNFTHVIFSDVFIFRMKKIHVYFILVLYMLFFGSYCDENETEFGEKNSGSSLSIDVLKISLFGLHK